MKKENFFYLGTILKTHGVFGELVLKIEVDFFDLLIDDLESIFIEIDEQLIPFFIHDIDYRNEDTAIVSLDDYLDEKKAKEFVGYQVFLPNELIPEEGSLSANLQIVKGYHVIDSNLGDLGTVNDILQYSFNRILQVIKDGVEILIPVSDTIIDEIDQANCTIRVTTPDGLVDIYLKNNS